MFGETRFSVAVLAAIPIMSIVSEGRGQTIETAEAGQAQPAVLARMADFQRAAEALDPEKVFSYVLDNDQGSLVENGRLHLTRQQALEATREGFEGLRSVEYRFDQQHVRMLSPTVALVVGVGVSSATVDDGRAIEVRFAQTVVMLLTNGQWKMLHAHRSFPPAD